MSAFIFIFTLLNGSSDSYTIYFLGRTCTAIFFSWREGVYPPRYMVVSPEEGATPPQRHGGSPWGRSGGVLIWGAFPGSTPRPPHKTITISKLKFCFMVTDERKEKKSAVFSGFRSIKLQMDVLNLINPRALYASIYSKCFNKYTQNNFIQQSHIPRQKRT